MSSPPPVKQLPLDPPAVMAATVLVDRFRVVFLLRERHWQRLTLGVFGGLCAVSFNLWHAPVTPWLSTTAAGLSGGLFIGLGALLLWIRSDTARRALHGSKEPPRERILQAVSCITQISNAWLLWAAAGHVVVIAGTVLHARLMVPAGALLLWLALLPTFGLIVYGVSCMPTRERLMSLLREGRK